MKPICIEDVPGKCPFCGSDKVAKRGSEWANKIWIRCTECEAMGPTADTLKKAIRKWNMAGRLDSTNGKASRREPK
jgi:Lar family restriction alleviation protein